MTSMVYSPGFVAGGITSFKLGSGVDVVRTRMGNSSGGVIRTDVMDVITGTPSQGCGAGFTGDGPERPGSDRLREKSALQAEADE